MRRLTPDMARVAQGIAVHILYDEFAPKPTSRFHVYGNTRRGIGASDKPATA